MFSLDSVSLYRHNGLILNNLIFPQTMSKQREGIYFKEFFLLKSGINNKLIRIFIIQMLFISVVTAMGVYVAAIIVEQVMVRAALEDEAAHYWKALEADSSHPTPNTDNLRGYKTALSELDSLPDFLQSKQPGYARVNTQDREPILYIEDKGSERLFLLFDEQSVRSLSFYFGVVPLSLVLIIIYLSAWFVYRYSRKTLSPLMSLAQTMRDFDLSKHKLDSLHLEDYTHTRVGDEVRVLAESLKEFTERLKRQLQREREFTHDVSHELRTPLAVIRGSLEILEKQKPVTPIQQRAIKRMQTTSSDMLSLIETLLVLARDSETSEQPNERIEINQLLLTLIQQTNRTHNADQHVEITLKETAQLEVNASSQAVSIVVGNLLQNACNYTDRGEIVVEVKAGSVSVSDTGSGIAEDALERIQQPFQRSSDQVDGYGLGLDIVRRLCERFGWELQIISRLNQGTTVTVNFIKVSN